VAPPDPALMSDDAESSLWRRYLEVSPGVQAARNNHRCDDALRLMASLRGAVDAFFDQVLVMAEDPAVRRNRLALLSQLARLFLSLADISQMVIERVS
jgi:glycyl-tRNA synthetase beta chain